MRFFARRRKLFYKPKEKAASAMGLLALIGLAGFGAVYFGGQSSKTGMLMQQAKQNKYQVEGRRINLSNFALAQSLLAFRSVGSGVDRHLQSALYPIDYFDASQWDLTLNANFRDQSNTWSWDDSKNVLTVRNPVDGIINDAEAAKIMTGGQRISDVRSNEEAISTMSFDNVQFDAASGYLAVSIDALSETKVPNSKGGFVVIRDRARIPLQEAFSYKPRLQIRASDGRTIDSIRDAGRNPTASQPFPVGDIRFRLYGSGLVSRGVIYWTQGNVASVQDCLAVPARCHRHSFDSSSYASFFKKRQHNILAREQLIGEITAPFDLKPVVLESKGNGKAKGDGSTCHVDADEEADNEKDDEQFFTVYTEKEYTAFGLICGADINQCISTRIQFSIEDPGQKDVTAADVKRICSEPEERPLCIDGNGDNDYFLPTYNHGLNENNEFEMIFSEHHWDGWTKKMGYRQMKICIDGNANLQPVAANCPKNIASTADGCWQANYGGDWTKNRIYYVNPTTCEREFLFKRTACGCFTGDTKILLAGGIEKPISELSRKDKVWNPIRKRAMSIKRMVVGPEKNPLVYITSSIGTVKVTKYHPFPTLEGIKAAYRIRQGEIVYLYEGDRKREAQVSEVRFVQPETTPDVWNLELQGSDEAEDHFLVADGVVTGDLLIQSKLQKEEQQKNLSLDNSKGNP